METLRNLAERCDPQPVENSGGVVNRLTKVSELIPGLVDQGLMIRMMMKRRI